MKKLASSLAVGAVLFASGAQASIVWQWSYSGAGVSASGTLTTTDSADSNGFYSITGVSGEQNGVAITGLQPVGTAIPGNEGYPVDDLISKDGPQLTVNGFGFSLADGSYANPYYADFNSPPGYALVLTNPADGFFSEPSIAFTASPVPEARTWTLALVAFAALGALRGKVLRARASAT